VSQNCGPPIFPPSLTKGSPTFWVPLVAWLQELATRPLFLVLGGTSPMPPGKGLRPLHPPLPTPAGLGFAGVLGPTRGGIANVGSSPPLLNLWGDTPHDPPPWGLRPLDPPFCPPPLAQGLPAFWVPLVAGLLMEATRPLLRFRGGTPPIAPRQGACGPLDPPFSHPRGLRVRQSFHLCSWKTAKR
jgi:hypothetical protein